MKDKVRRQYQGCTVAFLTKHGKQHIVQSPLESELGCKLVHTDVFDTDQLGTFTRETERLGSQLAAARKKAAIGMELTGAQLGLASEGSFGPDPYASMVTWNTELLLWIDNHKGIEVAGIAQGPAQSTHCLVKNISELDNFVIVSLFPEHHLVMRPEHQDHPLIYKDIKTRDQLQEAFYLCKAQSSNGLVFVENDLRAFSNPTRQEMIRKAAANLVEKLLSQCPQCESPGYTIKDFLPGLPCRSCAHKTRVPTAEIWQCIACKHTATELLNVGQWAEPGRCDYCNP